MSTDELDFKSIILHHPCAPRRIAPSGRRPDRHSVRPLRPRTTRTYGMRTTLVDIAREAGVSTATVDRVLNNREGVRERTRVQVLAAAASLGYMPETAQATYPPLDVVDLDIVLPGGTNTFINNLAARFADTAAARPDVNLRIHSIEGFEPVLLAEKLEALRGESQGVALIGLDHPVVREAIRALAAADVPVMTLVS